MSKRIAKKSNILAIPRKLAKVLKPRDTRENAQEEEEQEMDGSFKKGIIYNTIDMNPLLFQFGMAYLASDKSNFTKFLDSSGNEVEADKFRVLYQYHSVRKNATVYAIPKPGGIETALLTEQPITYRDTILKLSLNGMQIDRGIGDIFIKPKDIKKKTCGLQGMPKVYSSSRLILTARRKLPPTEYCSICTFNRSEHVALPCGHKICTRCVNKLIVKVCPYCRNPINYFHK